MPFFSVIVPVYNVEPYLETCVSSVCQQTLSNIEVILVNDGSSDRSGLICDRLGASDSRISVLHKPNGGLSSARNRGLELASGDYVLFLDSDDFYDDLGFCRTLRSHLLTNDLPEMTIFGRKYLREASATGVPDRAVLSESLNRLCVTELLRVLVATESLAVSACTRAVRRDWLLENDLTFTPALLSEDVEWSLRAFDRLSRLTVLDLKPYIYRAYRQDSITHTVGRRHVEDGIGTLEMYACNFPYSSEEMREIVFSYLAYQYCIFTANANRLPHCEAGPCIERLRRLRGLLAYGTSRRVRAVRRIDGLLGFSLTGRLLACALEHHG